MSLPVAASRCQSLPAEDSGDAFLRFGEALAPLRERGIALVCSGGATHNQDFFRLQFVTRRLPMGGDDAAVAERRLAILEGEAAIERNAPWSVAFDGWLTSTLARTGPAERNADLLRYTDAPGAAMSHPEPSHFWPLLVFAGASPTGGADRIASGFQHGLSMSAYRTT